MFAEQKVLIVGGRELAVGYAYDLGEVKKKTFNIYVDY